MGSLFGRTGRESSRETRASLSGTLSARQGFPHHQVHGLPGAGARDAFTSRASSKPSSVRNHHSPDGGGRGLVRTDRGAFSPSLQASGRWFYTSEYHLMKLKFLPMGCECQACSHSGLLLSAFGNLFWAGPRAGRWAPRQPLSSSPSGAHSLGEKETSEEAALGLSHLSTVLGLGRPRAEPSSRPGPLAKASWRTCFPELKG